MSSDQQPSLWNDVKAGAAVAGKRASIAGQKAKTRADILLMDNRIKARKQKLGIELYDFLVPFAEKDPHFIIESDTLTNIQGFFVTCFKDNKAILLKKAKKERELAELNEKRAQAFPVPAETFGGKLKNAGKAASMTGSETKIKAAIAMMEREMKANKQTFGVETYHLLVKLEDEEKWLPSDRDVRFFYDQARREIMAMEQEKGNKKAELAVLDWRS